jgi:hypothetical protein
MKLTHEELDFLSAWAREEWEPACYQLPAHRLQLAHDVSAAQLIAFIKVWTKAEGKKDGEILGAATNPAPDWPWPTTEDFSARLAEAIGDNGFIDELLSVNPKCQALVAKSKASPRKPFAAG